MKVTTAFRVLVYDSFADSVDENLETGEQTILESV